MTGEKMKAIAALLALVAVVGSAAAAGLPSGSHAASRLMIQPRGSSSGSNGRSWVSPRSRAPMAMAGPYRHGRGKNACRPGACAAQLGGDVVTDTVFGGLSNFLQLYNIVLTGRILLSWFPNIARQPVFEPLFVVTNPFFSLFRGLIPPIGGLDLSPLPAFFLLSFLTNATQSLGAELPSSKDKRPGAGAVGRRRAPLAAVMLQRQHEAMAALARVRASMGGLALPRSVLPSLALPPTTSRQ